ncbi:LLM class flavin-dependent oxidoreductase [Marinobacterium aestuariivivens]|uniref:LLM class flavin-dependent oxidoreductase n=1 Tax=Marinobacterium aestuariivivens TaxID=1698799 RepID=A0ABW1ZZ46_9GAMM
MTALKLSIVDQSPVHDDKTQAAALSDSVRLARLADGLGYHRFWVAEHHGTPSYASSAPEILIGQIAAGTQRIRVGSGGVMLSHYSPYKVAEVFRTLEALFPGRIDLGVGRAPGGAGQTGAALAYPDLPTPVNHFPYLLEALTGFIDGGLPEGHAFDNLPTTPQGGDTRPQLWALGSSDGSIELAAQLGWGFVLALFIGTHERPADIISRYRKLYRPRPDTVGTQGSAMTASAVICAETAEESELLAASHTYWKLQAHRHGIREGILPPERCMDLYARLSPSDKAFFDATRDSMITGTPEQCRAQLEAQAEYYGVDEILIVAVTHSFEKRCESYRKLAAAFDLGA